MVDNPLLDPANLARIDDLSLLAKVVVEGNHFGLHRSRRQGHGNEFFQYRKYEPGEDLKNIDWKVFAKQNDLVSKTYEETSNTNLILILDASASMGFQGTSSPCSKFRYAQMLAACLAYLAYRQGDRIGLFGGNQENLQWLFPEAGKESFKSILSTIGSIIPSGKDPGINHGISSRLTFLPSRLSWSSPIFLKMRIKLIRDLALLVPLGTNVCASRSWIL